MQSTAVDRVRPSGMLGQVQMHLRLIYGFPIKSHRFYQFICNPIYITAIFIVLFSYSLSSLSFLLFNAKTFIDFMESLFWASRSLLSLGMYTAFVWYKQDLTKMLDNLSEIVRERQKKQQATSHFYDRADQQAAVIAKRIYIHTFILSPALYSVPIIWKSCYNYIITDHSTNETFQLFYPTQLPYDWRAPLGYLFAVSYQLTTFLGVLEVFVTCLVIYCSVCKFSVAFADDLVANFNEICRKIGECNGHFVAKKETILNQELTEIMDFQRNAVQLVTQLAKLYKPFLSMIFAVVPVYLCLFLLRFQVDIENGDILNVVRSLVRMNGWFLGFYFICRFGDDVTARFDPIANIIRQCARQDMPTTTRECLNTMIVPLQKPIYMYGCFDIRCIRATFKKTMFAVIFHFLILSQIV